MTLFFKPPLSPLGRKVVEAYSRDRGTGPKRSGEAIAAFASAGHAETGKGLDAVTGHGRPTSRT